MKKSTLFLLSMCLFSLGTSNVANGQAILDKNDAKFLKEAIPLAKKEANKLKLYPSVMLAQSIHESGWGQSELAEAPNNNLFGIKGNYKGKSVKFKTQEWSKKKGWRTINANFRKYPSCAESFRDNGLLLRNETKHREKIYRGAWRENAKTYKDATKWLKGRYATDPTYDEFLNKIIEKYSLGRYDNSAKETKATGSITTLSETNIYNKPSIKAKTEKKIIEDSDLNYSSYVDDGFGHRFYKIADDQFVLSNDAVIANQPNPINGFIKLNMRAQVYSLFDGVMIPIEGENLEIDSNWYVNENYKDADGDTFYRVSENEWIVTSEFKLNLI